MADTVSESVKINATPEEVMAVIANLEDYPNWGGGFTGVGSSAPMTTVQRRTWRSASPPRWARTPTDLSYIWTGNDGVSWTLNNDGDSKPKSSMMKKLAGSYTRQAGGFGHQGHLRTGDRPQDPDDGLHEEGRRDDRRPGTQRAEEARRS